MSSQAQKAASESSSDSSASSVSSGDDDDGENVFEWDKNFTTWKQTIVSTLSPSLLVMRNPFFWLLVVLFMALLGGVGVCIALAFKCEWNVSYAGGAHKTLGKYKKLLYRGNMPDNTPVIFPEDLGVPFCIYEVSVAPDTEGNYSPFTMSRPFRQQVSGHFAIGEYKPCFPIPYADGTPHFFEVIWQEATGRPQEFCNYKGSYKGWSESAAPGAPPCRNFTSSAEQTAALKARFLPDGNIDPESFLETHHTSAWNVRFKKCQPWYVIVPHGLSVVMAIML